MNKNQYKLKLIKDLMQCENREVLETIEQLLHMDAAANPEPRFQSPTAYPEDTELHDLQQSIQEVFGEDKPE